MKKLSFPEILLRVRKEKGLNQQDLADYIGVSKATISDYERGKSEPTLTNLVRLSEKLQLTLDALVHPMESAKNMENVHLNVHPSVHPSEKKGYQTVSDPDNVSRVNESMAAMYNRVPKVVTVDRAGNDTIAYVPIKAKAGYLTGYADPQFISTLPTYNFPGMQNATFRMFEIEGHSMVPTFDDSDIVIGRFIENLSQIRNDRVHIVVTKRDGLLIKRVLNRAVSDGKLILNSDNQKDPREYPPIVIAVEDVLEVWYGVAKFTRQMRAPGELHNKLIDLEARLTLLEESHRKSLAK